jgi:hypothetical protein
MPPSIMGPRFSLLCLPASAGTEWKTSHPSEDSEALSETSHQGIDQASSRTLDFFSDRASVPAPCMPQ